MSDFEYDYQRFDDILSKLVRDHCEVEDDPDFLQIGENISSIPAIKVIFDGFGLAEELYYNERTFQLEDGVVKVQNDDYEYEDLSEDDENYDYVLEKLELFEQYRNGDVPCNPDMQSFAVFIHKDAINDDFEFPEHEFTPWGLMHRTKEEVCVYVWWNREDDTMDILQLEDRLDEDSPFDEEGVMAILEKIAADNGFDDEIDNTVAWPFSRPTEGETKLNPNAAWPFATSPQTVSDEEAKVYNQELENEPAEYAPGELIRIEEMNGKRYEVRQPSAEFSKSFPGVLDMIEIKDPNEPKQDYRSILERVIAKRGLPKEVGAKGWISETQTFHYDGKPVATADEGLKGWLYVERDDDGDGEPSYKDVDELIEVCRAMIEDNNDDETSLVVNVLNAGPDDWDVRSVTIRNEEADGKSWDYEIDMDEDEFWEIVKRVMIENGEIDEPEEDEEIDNDNIDVNSFLWGYCDNVDGESRYSYGYGVAYMEFDDGFKVGMTMKDGELYIHYYDGKDVDKNTVFE